MIMVHPKSSENYEYHLLMNSEGVLSVTFITVGNRIDDPSSKPDRDSLLFTSLLRTASTILTQ